MPSSPVPRYYWDANVMLSFVNGDTDRLPDINAFMTSAEKNQIEIVTSMLSVVEVAFAAEEKVQGHLDAARRQNIETLWLPSSPIKRVDFHFGIAEDARELIRAAMIADWRLEPADAVHLATARRMAVGEVHTYEEHGRPQRWSELIGIPVGKPVHPSPPML